MKDRLMTGNWRKRMFLGGLATLFVNVALGIGCGLVLGSVLDRASGDPSSEGIPALILTAALPVYLIVTGGPVWGALLGLISSYLKSRRKIIGVAVLLGLSQTVVISLQLYVTALPFLMIYAALATISIAAGGMATTDIT
jgi:hypothetical protein